MTAATASLTSAAVDAQLAFEALLDALRRDTAEVHDAASAPCDDVDSAGLRTSQPLHAAATTSDSPLPLDAQAGDCPTPDVLAGISAAALSAEYRRTTWGQWVAGCGCVARGLAREAALRRAICDALLNAPPPRSDGDAGTGGHHVGGRHGGADEEPLSVDMCDALAQLWRLQPHVDDAVLRAVVSATQGD